MIRTSGNRPKNTLQVHYPFGMMMADRQWSSETNYRFGHNSQESDAEISGSWGSHYTAEYWMMDSRILKRWEPDPVVKPHESPYAVFANNPIWFVDPFGLDSFKVNSIGEVEKFGSTSETDFLFATNKQGEINTDIDLLEVKDKSILSQLTQDRTGDFNGIYTSSSEKEEMFNVFHFTVENTNVEWGITGHRMEGGNEYVLRTSHDKVGYGSGGVSSILTIDRYSDVFSMSFNIHSHPAGGTEGASNTVLYDDMDIVIDRYYIFKEAGMKNTNTWFKKDGKWTVFPKHYVYTKGSNNLYHYTPWDNDVFIRSIKNPNDLYRGLGF